LKNKDTYVKFLGSINYETALNIQKELFQEKINIKLENRKNDSSLKVSNHLLICEHPHVYTLGRSGDKSHLLVNDQTLEAQDAQFFEIGRGGDITYHGPGQLVIYPILDLDNFFTDIHKYLRLLEEAIILTLAEYNVSAGRIDGLTGVWIDHEEQTNPRKICAMGVKASRWVTMHGLALNINTDLNYFNNIVPCGINDKAVTALNKEVKLKVVDLQEVAKKLVKHIGHLFEMNLIINT